MAVTLLDARNFTQDHLDQMVIDEFRKDALFDLMKFDDTVTANGGGTLAYTYNRVTTLPTAGFRAINTEYVPQEAKTTQHTSNLRPFGGSFNVDRVLQNHVKGVKTQIGFQLEQKVKATKAVFVNAFVNGDTGVDANGFDGLDKAITGSSTDRVPEDVIDLSSADAIKANGTKFMYELDQMLAELDGEPTLIMINRYLAAVMNTIARSSGSFSTSDLDAFGKQVTKYGTITLYPVGDKSGTAQPIIPVAAGTRLTSLFAVRIGLDGAHALSPDGTNNINTYLPDLTKPGAVKMGEVEMVSSMALKSTKAAGKLSKIKI